MGGMSFMVLVWWSLSACSAEPEKPHAEALLEAAAAYESWGRLDDVARWTPLPCADAGARRAKQLTRFSETTEGPHKTKLYFLYAKDSKAYGAINWVDPSPVGQVLVKESFEPVSAPAKTAKPTARDKEGNEFVAGDRQELFLMLKLDPATPNTDDGWVYGVVSSDGKTVKESGVLPACQGCHHASKSDHLFGVGGRAR